MPFEFFSVTFLKSSAKPNSAKRIKHNRATNKNLFEKSPQRILENTTLPIIKRPPIVGVPSFTLCESGPLSPIVCWNWNDLIFWIKNSPNKTTINRPDNVDKNVLVLKYENRLRNGLFSKNKLRRYKKNFKYS